MEDTADNSKNRGHSREIHTWRTQQRVMHIDNTAGRYTLGGHIRVKSVGHIRGLIHIDNTAGRYTRGGHSRESQSGEHGRDFYT